MFAPNKPHLEGVLIKEDEYLLTRDEIVTLPLIAQLVVISGGWGTRQQMYVDVGYQMCSAFIAAGKFVVGI